MVRRKIIAIVTDLHWVLWVLGIQCCQFHLLGQQGQQGQDDHQCQAIPRGEDRDFYYWYIALLPYMHCTVLFREPTLQTLLSLNFLGAWQSLL